MISELKKDKELVEKENFQKKQQKRLDLKEQINRELFLLERGFIKKECNHCLSNYWQLELELERLCNSCTKKDLARVPEEIFLSLEKDQLQKKEELFCLKEFIKLTNNRAYRLTHKSLINYWSRQINFVTAGINVVLPIIFTTKFSKKLKETAKLIQECQFCLRFNDLEELDQIHSPGFFMLGWHLFNEANPSSSFVEGHQLFLDYFLKNLKLESRFITFEFEEWHSDFFQGEGLEIYYRGIELANCVWIDKIKLNNQVKTLGSPFIDIGIGLERVLQLYQPKGLGLSTNEKIIRTLIFSFNSGLYPSKRNIGWPIRKMIKLLKDLDKESIESIVDSQISKINQILKLFRKDNKLLKEKEVKELFFKIIEYEKTDRF